MKGKSFLEEKIAQIAHDEIAKEWKDFINMCADHPIARSLKLNGGRLFAGQSGGTSKKDVFSYWMDDMLREGEETQSNIKEVLNRAIEERISEKSRELLDRIKSIEYLFNKGGLR